MLELAGQTVSKYARLTGFPQADKDDKFSAVEVFCWWLAHKAPKPLQRSVAESLGAAVAPEPEESAEDDYQYRLHRAKALSHELELQRQQGSLVSVDDVVSDLGTLIKHLRASGEVLQKRFGREATEILEVAIQDAERELTELTE